MYVHVKLIVFLITFIVFNYFKLEDATRNGVIGVLVCEWKGCFFLLHPVHLAKRGLQIEYKERKDIRTFIRRAAVLPMIPTTQV